MNGVQALTIRGVERGAVRRFRAISQALGMAQPVLFLVAVDLLADKYSKRIRFQGRGQRGKTQGRRKG